MKPKRILHCHSTFSLGGKEARAVRLMNVFGDAAKHTIISAEPEALDARDAIDPGIKANFPGEAAPSLQGKPGLDRYRRLAAYMRGFDLVLTYNWGAMDAVGARRIFPKGCPPLIHHEDGFNADEADRLNWKRNAFRRVTLAAAKHLIVPSHRLEDISARDWNREAIRIPNGIAAELYAFPPEPEGIPGLKRVDGDVVIGTIAGLRPVKNLPRLIRAVATLPTNVKLAIVGEGPEREAIVAEAVRTKMGDRLILPGFLPQPHRYIGHFDIFALSSDSEQFPISLVEAMAAGLPVAATDVGDVRDMVSDGNRAFIVPPPDEAALAGALGWLAEDPAIRGSLGTANRALAVSDYNEQSMIGHYRKIYEIEEN